MEHGRHDFDVEYYQKNDFITNDIFGFIADDFDYRMKELTYKVKKKIEQIVIEKGWLTTYYGVFAIIRPIMHMQTVAMLVTYKPTLQYNVITDVSQMRDELYLLKNTTIVL